MPTWVSEHKSDIQFVMWMIVGTFLILYGTTLVGDSEPGLIALGAGAIGLPGFQAARREDEAP